MDIETFYGYVMRTRRDLWSVLEDAPDEVLSGARVGNERFPSLKDLLVHVAAVEDSWLHEDILRTEPLWRGVPAVARGAEGATHEGMTVGEILEYWRRVEKATLGYLEGATAVELEREVTADAGSEFERTMRVSEILWHVMLHEVRHQAQAVLVLRQAGIKPPSLDLLFFLPLERR